MGEIKYQTQLLQNDSADVRPQYKNLYKTHFLCGNYTERRSRRSLTKTVASLGTGFTVAFVLFRWRNFRWAFIVIKVAKGNERWGTGELIARARNDRLSWLLTAGTAWSMILHQSLVNPFYGLFQLLLLVRNKAVLRHVPCSVLIGVVIAKFSWNTSGIVFIEVFS